jgi:hypothetical protein
MRGLIGLKIEFDSEIGLVGIVRILCLTKIHAWKLISKNAGKGSLE